MRRTLSIATITGSPVRPSRTEAVAHLVERQLRCESFGVSTLHVRDLPAEALLHADFDDPVIKQATRRVAQSDGVVIVSPVYKAAYTGAIKSFLDMLPQFALRNKVVLPLLIGGSLAHVLAIDYAIRPMLQSLDPRLIVNGLFILDKTVDVSGGSVVLTPDVAVRLQQVVQVFIEGLRAHDSFSNAQDPSSLELAGIAEWG